MFSSVSCDFGNLFDIPIDSLTEVQLQSINIKKLVELASGRPEIENIIINRMGTMNLELSEKLDILIINSADTPLLNKEYNDIINNHWEEILSFPYYCRSKYINWEKLNTSNQIKEWRKILEHKSSEARFDKESLQTLYKYSESLFDSVVDYSIKDMFGRRVKEIINFLSDRPDKLEEVFKKIDDSGMSKSIYLTIESSNEDRVYKALRSIHKKTNIPKITCKITAGALKKMPPIMRLDIIEKIIFDYRSTYKLITDNVSKSDLTNLLFPSITRYPGRVQRILNYTGVINAYAVQENTNG